MTTGRPAVVTRDGVAMTFRPPAPALAELVIDYAFYDSGPAGSQRRVNEYLPGPANISMTFDAGHLSASVRHHRLAWTNDAVVFGPTSHAFRVESHGGRLVGIGLTALGWSRLFGKNADAAANRILPLAALWDEARAYRLHAAVAAAGTDEDAVAATLDAHLAAALLPETRDTSAIRGLTAIVQEAEVEECAEAAARLGLGETQLRRIAKHYFGFGPKLLLRRHRFMRAMADLRGGGGGGFTTYYDQSHFIRDAHLFLGRTARQFGLALTPMMEGMLAGRTASFGAPAQGLIAAGRDNVNPG